MKKRILSVLLCLCMALVLLPTTALAEEPQPLENVTFDFAYDVQRDPDFPTKAGNVTVTMSYPDDPLLSGTQSEGNAVRKNTNEGEWTLTKVGTYSDVESIEQNSSILESIVGEVAKNYGLAEETIVIHELTDGGSHVAYGVVLAYNATAGIAVFVGDLWNKWGAGYLLSTTEKSGEVIVTADMIATDFSPRISLNPAGSHIFPEATEGYGDQTPLTVTVTNNGNAATGELTVALDGNTNAFVVVPDTIKSIAVGGEASFTVTPTTGLDAGTYTATVTVIGTGGTDGTDIVTQSFDVKFTVKAAAPVVKPPRPNTPSDSTPVTIDSPKTADNSGLFLWTVLLFASSAGVLGTAVYSNRKRRAE